MRKEGEFVMKRFLVFVMVFLSVFLGVASAWAGGAPVLVDAERTARAFLSHDVVRYSGDVHFTRVYTNGGKLEVNGHFDLNPDGYITSLEIDGVVIVGKGDEPIGGMPQNVEGLATDYYVWMTGYTAEGFNSVYGNFYSPLLKEGDPITVSLQLGWDNVFVPYTIVEGMDVDSLRLQIGYNQFCYDQTNEGFYVWFDPTASAPYEVVNYLTGVIYDRGNLDNFRTDETVESVVSFQYPAGLINLTPDGYCRQMSNIPLDSQVVRDGVMVPAKVFLARTFGNYLYLDFSSYSSKTVEVREWRPYGEEMPVLFSVDLLFESWSGGGGIYHSYVSVPPGYDRLVITVLGNEETSLGDLFNINGGKG